MAVITQTQSLKFHQILAIIFTTFFTTISSGVLAQSCTGGTFQNVSNSSTTPLGDTANGQCLANSGTITPPIGDMGFSLSYSGTSVLNTGTVILSGEATNAVYSWGGNGSVNSIVNSGLITSNSGSYNTIAIWLVNGTGTVSSIENSGTIRMSNSGQSQAIFIYSNNTVQNLTNSGSISVAGAYGAIANNGNITTLNNTGSIVSTGNAYGIVNNGSIETINNTGSISVLTAGYYGIQNNSGGTIGALNNSQGATSSAGALTYTGVLPSSYNVIINSALSYGQLSGATVSGSTTFGIYSGGVSGVSASTLTKGTYASVLTGITSSNLTGTTSGNYNGFTWSLNNSSGSIWDLVVTGASTVDTQQSLVNTASALRNAYALQNTVLVNGFSYDCPVFDKNGICLSTGGRYSTTNANSVSNTSALLIGAYRLSKQIRLGAYVDQNLSSSGNTVNLNNSKPMIGLFGIWNEREDGIGAEVKVSAGFGKKGTTITRQVVGTSEGGSGSSILNTTGAQITAKYNMAAMDKTIVSPYVGIRYTQNRMNSYAEAANSNVTAPLTYTALNTDATTAIAGVGVKYQLDSKMTLLASAGVESDLSNNHGTYSATGITGLTPINFNANPVKVRASAVLGAYYDVEKNQRFAITGIYRQEAYRSVNTTAVFATYMVGL
jgi:hypothetical protein